MGTVSDKLTYLNTTKEKIKENLNYAGCNITNEPFRQYASILKDKFVSIISNPEQEANAIYDSFPKAINTGTHITTNTYNTRFDMVLLGDTEQSVLPDGYTQVEYIESSGTQYINLGYKPTIYDTIETKFQTQATTTDKNLYGSRYSGGQQDFSIWINTSTNKGIAVHYPISKTTGTDTGWVYKDDIVSSPVELKITPTNIYVNDVSKYTFNDSRTAYTGDYNAYLFAQNQRDSVIYAGNFKIYYFKIYSNGALVRDLIPCYNSSNVIGLYDLVNGVFYQNAGTGTFTKGADVPNPNTPQPVENVSGLQDIEVCGKNLFDKDNIISGYRLDGRGVASGVASNEFTSDFIAIKPSTTYIRSIGDISAYTRTCFYDSSKTFISKDDSNQTFTTPSNAYYLRFSEYTSRLDTVQLEKGSTITSYEPYKSNTYPLYLGVENLFDYENTTFNNNSTGTTTKTSEYVKATPNTTSNYSGFYVANNDLPNITTTSLSFKAKADSSRTINIVYFNKSITISLTTEWQTFKVENATHNSNSMDFYSGSDHSGVAFYVKDIQIEKGSKANSYSAYGTTPIELCKIGTYQDYIYKDNGSWYLHKEIGKVVLDGSESWGIRTDVVQTGYTCFMNGSYVVNSRYTNSNITNVYCNYFVVLAQYTGQPMIRIINVNGYGETVMFPSSIASTEANFKTWLSSHNTILYYVLPTPTAYEITDTTLISQLESLSS